MHIHPATPRPRGAVRRLALLGVLLAAAGATGARPAAPTPSASAATFVVVVHASNSATALPKAEVSHLFLKKVATWPSGDDVVAIDLPVKAPARYAFSHMIHGKAPEAIKSYWRQQLFTGRAVPPVERASERDVLAAISLDPAAIGYVSSTTPLPKNVKEIEVILE